MQVFALLSHMLYIFYRAKNRNGMRHTFLNSNQSCTPYGSGASTAGSSAMSSSSQFTSSSVSVSTMSSISNQVSPSGGDVTSGIYFYMCVILPDGNMHFHYTGLLQEILKELQSSNKRDAELEKKLDMMQEGVRQSSAGKKTKTVPSSDFCVKMNAGSHSSFMSCTYFHAVVLPQSAVKNVYKVLAEEDIDFGWDLELGFT